MTDAAPPDRSTWVEGERVFGPPLGTYDADWVAGAACRLDAGITHAQAHALALQAWAALRQGVPATALAQALPAPGGAVVAAVAAEFCALYGIDPGSAGGPSAGDAP